jgi:hypothetical protein
VLLYPPALEADPAALDLGVVPLGSRRRAEVIFVSGAPTRVALEAPPWLVRVDGAGRAVDGPLDLNPNTPVRVTFDVEWAPIRLRGAKSIAGGRPLRPTGTVRARFGNESLEIPASMVVETR